MWPRAQREWLALGAIVILAICVRLYRIGLDSFWLDESASWWFSSRPLAEQWGQIPFYEPHPPLYYGLLWLWSRLFGEGEAALRGLSAFASVLIVPVAYGMGRLTLGGKKGVWIGLLGAALVALYPAQIQYAQEARAYALLTLAVSVLLVSLLWLIAHPETLTRPLRAIFRDSSSGARAAVSGVVFATASSFWLHNTALILAGPLLLVAALLVFSKISFSWQLARNFFLIGIAILLLWAPNIRWLVSGMTEVTAGFWLQRPRWWDVMYVSDELLGSMNIAEHISWKIGLTALTLLLVGLGTAALWRRGSRQAAVLLASAVFMPFALCVLASYIITPIFMTRVLLWIEIPALVLIAANLLWLPSVFLRRSIAAIAVGFLAVVVVSGWGRNVKEPWRDVARTIVEEAGPDDLIIADTAYAQVPMLYYRVPERSSARWLPLPDAYPLPLGKSGYPDGFFVRVKIDEATLDRVRAAARSSQKIWYVTRGRTVYDWEQQLPRALREVRGPGVVRFSDGDSVMLTEYGK